MNDIREKDWKTARSMQERVLNLACERILEKVSGILKNDDDDSHAKYIELWKTLHAENRWIKIMFDDFKRSSAIDQISFWRFCDLITDDEMALFSPETQDRIETLIEIRR